MPPVHRDVLVALPAELVLLGLLSLARPLSGIARAVGRVVMVGTAAILVGGFIRSGARVLGPSNRVMLGRAVAVPAVAALVAEALPHGARPEPLAAVADVPLLLEPGGGWGGRR